VNLALEGNTQPELQLPGRAERIDTCSDPNAVYIVPGVCGSVDLPGSSRQQVVFEVNLWTSSRVWKPPYPIGFGW
jgi:hypothetical protein